ncbi:MAG TPA: DUF1330 domain-containing protein [Roseiflexaceae bacterium]|nr:DUF1330 domain-containing protein [Roseiflexaceae bacterium]
MAAYVIFIREQTINPAAFERYTQEAPPTLNGQPVTVHAFNGHHQALEGPDPEGVIIISFPSFEEAMAWYNGPAYQEARQHRLQNAQYRVIIVQGV